MENIYDFEVQKSNGENYKLDVYKAMLCLSLIRVNVDLQFEGLQELYNK